MVTLATPHSQRCNDNNIIPGNTTSGSTGGTIDFSRHHNNDLCNDSQEELPPPLHGVGVHHASPPPSGGDATNTTVVGGVANPHTATTPDLATLFAELDILRTQANNTNVPSL